MNKNLPKAITSFILVIAFFYASGQGVIYVPNKSLEDTVLHNKESVPLLWTICSWTPQVMTNSDYGVFPNYPKASNKNYYILLQGSLWMPYSEKIGVKLIGTLKAPKRYFMYLDLREYLDQSNQDALAEIYGGTYLCDTTYKLWTSPGLDSSHWTRFKATFTAPVDIDYIILSSRNEFPQDFQGAALIDNLSDIYDSATYVGMDEAQIKAAVAAEQGQLQISPNPATNQLRITNEAFQIEELEIYDVMGRSQFVAPLRFDKLKAEQIQLDVSKLNEGIYFVKAIYKYGNFKTGKFVKE
jgi:hypothetical protein